MTLRIKIRNEFVPIVLLDGVLVLLIAFFPVFVLRVILGLPVLFLFPGYVVTAALFPAGDSLNIGERMGLSLGFSVLISTACGVIFNYSPWGINGVTLSASVTAVTFLVSVIAWRRRRFYRENTVTGIGFTLSLPHWSGSKVEKSLLVGLIAAILLSIAGLGYAASHPKNVERFTEFMVFHADGTSINGTFQATVGIESQVMLRIVNHEHRSTSYAVHVTAFGQPPRDISPIVLGQDQVWQDLVSFTPQTAVSSQELSFQLFKSGDSAPYRSLHLWVNTK